jgi:DHA2 family multidrug resistance protein-like MFS transporter
MDVSAAAHITDRGPDSSRLRNIAALSIGTAAIVLDSGMAVVTLPTIASQLGMPDSRVVLIVTCYQLVLISTILSFAALADKIGYQRLYRYGQGIIVVAACCVYFVDNLQSLIVVRLLQALGAAAALSVTAAMVRTLYPPQQLGRGLAFNSILISAAAALAPTIGGYVLHYLPWQTCFLVAAPLILLSLLIGRRDNEKEAISANFDGQAALLCVSFIALTIGGIEFGFHAGSWSAGLGLILGGVGTGWLLFRRERGKERPVLPFDLLTNSYFRRAFLAAVSSYLASMIVIIYMPFWLSRVHGSDTIAIGQLMAIWPLTMLVISPFAGILSDRIRPGLLGALGMAILVAAMAMLALLPNGAGFFDIGWRFLLGGVGFGLFLAPNSRLIVSVASPSRTASAGSMVSTARLFGQALGATAVAAILSMVGTNSAWPFLMAAGFAALAFLLSALQLLPSGKANELHTEAGEIGHVKPSRQ